MILLAAESTALSLSIDGPRLFLRRLFPRLERPLDTRLKDLTLLLDASRDMNVSVPWNAPKFVWSTAWKLHERLLPFLHYWDSCLSKNTNLNLAVLWWKSISGNRKGTIVADGGIAYDFLPSFTRLLVSFPLAYLYPNLHHQNVAIRTRYLDTMIKTEIASIRKAYGSEELIDIVVLGSGFDPRAVKFLGNAEERGEEIGLVNWSEVDLPEVIEQKCKIFARFLSRRKKVFSARMPSLYGGDLNDIAKIKDVLNAILKKNDETGSLIIVVEAVLMYLQEEKVKPLLQMCFNEVGKVHSNRRVSFVFADRLDNEISGNVVNCCKTLKEEKNAACRYLNDIGMELVDWRPKPGRARHMGVARVLGRNKVDDANRIISSAHVPA